MLYPFDVIRMLFEVVCLMLVEHVSRLCASVSHVRRACAEMSRY